MRLLRTVLTIAVLLYCGSALPQVTGQASSTTAHGAKGSNASEIPTQRDASCLNVSIPNGAVDLLLTAPYGKKLGEDPIHHRSFDEIEKSSYDAGGLDDDETGARDEDPAHSISIGDPRAGWYTLQMFGNRNSEYVITISASGTVGTMMQQNLAQRIRKDEVQSIRIHYDSRAQDVLQLSPSTR